MSFRVAGIVWDPQNQYPPQLVGGPPKLDPHTFHSLSMQPEHAAFDEASFITNEIPSTPGTVNEPKQNVLPPLSISIDGRIVDDTARVTVSQIFWNNFNDSIAHASFVFPLPSGCTVTSFKCRVGRNKTLIAKALPKYEADKAFQKAIKGNRTAALLRQNTPEIFTASLGNFPANTKLRTELTYTTLLKRLCSPVKIITTLSIPTAIADRYGDAPEDIGVMYKKLPENFTLQLEIMEVEELIEVKSATHKISLSRDVYESEISNWEDLSRQRDQSRVTRAMVRLDPGAEYSHDDFVLTIETRFKASAGTPHAWLESHPSLEDQKALMITIPPSVMIETSGTSATGEIVFVVDRSGSMADKIDILKCTLKSFLKEIPTGRTFNIWSFGSHWDKLWTESHAYSPRSLEIAIEYVESMKADMGGTELLYVLDSMLPQIDHSCPCDVIIVTDGQIWRLDDTLTLIQHKRTVSRGAVRFSSLGLGAHVSHALVEGIATRGGGYFDIIPSATLDSLKDRVVAILKAALTNHYTLWRIRVNEDANLDGLLTSPNGVGSMNLFQGNRIYMLSRPDFPPGSLKGITLETLRPNDVQVSTPVSMTVLEKPDTTIHTLAARAILNDLEYLQNTVTEYDKLKWNQAEAQAPTEAEIQAQALTEARAHAKVQAEYLACRFSLASAWTSLFLQQENRESRDDELVHAAMQVQGTTDGLDLLQPRGANLAMMSTIQHSPAFSGPPPFSVLDQLAGPPRMRKLTLSVIGNESSDASTSVVRASMVRVVRKMRKLFGGLLEHGCRNSKSIWNRTRAKVVGRTKTQDLAEFKATKPTDPTAKQPFSKGSLPPNADIISIGHEERNPRDPLLLQCEPVYTNDYTNRYRLQAAPMD